MSVSCCLPMWSLARPQSQCTSCCAAARSGRRPSLFVGLSHSCRSFYKTHPPRLPLRRLPAEASLHSTLHRPRISASPPSLNQYQNQLFVLQRRLLQTFASMTGNWPEAQVRKTFFDFFEQRGHTLGKSRGEERKKIGIFCLSIANFPSKWRGRVDDCRVFCGVAQHQTWNSLLLSALLVALCSYNAVFSFIFILRFFLSSLHHIVLPWRVTHVLTLFTSALWFRRPSQ